MKKIFLLFLITTALFSKDAKVAIGAALGTLYFPDYIGSKNTHVLVLPYPYVRYKSEFLNIDKDGVRTTLFDIKNLMLDVSVGGTLPAQSSNSKVREGMPNLDLTFEFGPKITYKFYQNGVAHLYFELPVRGVFSTGFTFINHQGFISTPQIKYALEYKHFEFRLRSGIVVADKGYNDYFYTVKPEYQTATRPAYNASGGFNGFRNKVSCEYTKGIGTGVHL